jgi:hypothetical protein
MSRSLSVTELAATGMMIGPHDLWMAVDVWGEPGLCVMRCVGGGYVRWARSTLSA